MRQPQQRFNVRLHVGQRADQTVFIAGERLDITLESERAATLLLLNVDPQGEV